MKKKNKVVTSTGVEVRQKPLKLRIWNNRGYYLMFLPVLLFTLIMYYWPMLGVRYAFYDFKAIGTPKWVGLAHFQKMFATTAFWTAFKNTLLLSIMKMLITVLKLEKQDINSVCKENLADYYIFASLYVMGSSCFNFQLDSLSIQHRYD